MDAATAAVMAAGAAAHVRIGDSPPRGQPLTREQALAPYGGLGECSGGAAQSSLVVVGFLLCMGRRKGPE